MHTKHRTVGLQRVIEYRFKIGAQPVRSILKDVWVIRRAFKEQLVTSDSLIYIVLERHHGIKSRENDCYLLEIHRHDSRS